MVNLKQESLSQMKDWHSEIFHSFDLSPLCRTKVHKHYEQYMQAN